MTRPIMHTEDMVAKYLESPSQCPVCDSDNIEAGHIEVDGDEAWSMVHCYKCGARWNDIYHLANMELLQVGCDTCKGEGVIVAGYALGGAKLTQTCPTCNGAGEVDWDG